jgi:hypothetical protein
MQTGSPKAPQLHRDMTVVMMIIREHNEHFVLNKEGRFAADSLSVASGSAA